MPRCWGWREIEGGDDGVGFGLHGAEDGEHAVSLGEEARSFAAALRVDSDCCWDSMGCLTMSARRAVAW